jgi:hypothetical protein
MPHGYERSGSKFVAFHIRPQNNLPIFPKMAVTKFYSIHQPLKTVALMKKRRISNGMSAVGPNVHAAPTCPSLTCSAEENRFSFKYIAVRVNPT